jgi:hypothetical protein
MKLNNHEIETIIQDFPKFELSCETIVHKKVHNTDIFLAIPYGIKCFAWFTTYKTDNVCFIMEINGKHITNIRPVLCSFDTSLSCGTIFYGTLFKYKNTHCFCIEDIYFYKGKECNKQNYLNKLTLFKKIMSSEITQTALNTQFVIFGLPLIMQDFRCILRDIEILPYKVNQIKFYSSKYYQPSTVYTMNYYKPSSYKKNDEQHLSKAVFKITPDIQNDIYNLFFYKNGQDEFYDIAFIPDYKTSVMMNNLFRNIKENKNLDTLEESDDEEEFENENEDKYVYLNRSYKMNCEYNHKFKKWVPISLANKHDKLVTFSMFSNKNYNHTHRTN